MSQFRDLIVKANQQEEPQRILFLFAKSNNLLKEKTGETYQSGTIEPIMCVDKLPSELSEFSLLVDEADSISKNWDFIFVSSLSGVSGKTPTSEDATYYLQKMSNHLAQGGDLSQYLVWNRKEQEIIIC